MIQFGGSAQAARPRTRGYACGVPYCPSCRRETRYTRPERTNHVLHLLLSVVTLGLWLPVWAIVAAVNASKPARCSICGTFGTGPA